MCKPFLSFLAFGLCLAMEAQVPIDVTENTFKVAGNEEVVFYYGFAEGDQLIFNFEEVDGKEMKEVEIIEYPASSHFMDYKSKKIENKTLSVSETGIYKFRFANEALLGRVCRFKIQRIPASEKTRIFNTNVFWHTVYDTSFTMEEEKYLVSSDTTASEVLNQVAKVHSTGNLNGNTNSINFTLPDNVYSWSYYIGVDQAGQQALADAAAQLSGTAGAAVSKIPGYGPLAALALDAACFIPRLQGGEDIDFWLLEGDNITLFLSGQDCRSLRKGKVLNDFSKLRPPASQNCLIYLSNDNAITGVDVTVAVMAVTIEQQWGRRQVKKMQVGTREEAYLKTD